MSSPYLLYMRYRCIVYRGALILYMRNQYTMHVAPVHYTCGTGALCMWRRFTVHVAPVHYACGSGSLYMWRRLPVHVAPIFATSKQRF